MSNLTCAASCFPAVAPTGQKRKKRARKVIQTFRTLIGAQAIFHFSPQAQVVLRQTPVSLKSEIQPMDIARPLERPLNQLKRTTLTTYAMQFLRLPTGQRPAHGLSP